MQVLTLEMLKDTTIYDLVFAKIKRHRSFEDLEDLYEKYKKGIELEDTDYLFINRIDETKNIPYIGLDIIDVTTFVNFDDVSYIINDSCSYDISEVDLSSSMCVGGFINIDIHFKVFNGDIIIEEDISHARELYINEILKNGDKKKKKVIF